MGIEALSRGAATLVSVERSKRAAGILSDNLETCGASDQSEIRIGDVARILSALHADGARFDGVLIDPPYDEGLAERALASLAEFDMIADGGWAVAETARGEQLPIAVGRLHRVRDDLYGDTKVTLYENREAGGS